MSKAKNIKPFSVDARAENLSKEQVTKLHEWCLIAGDLDESLDDWLEYYDDGYPYLGLDSELETMSQTSPQDNNIILFCNVREYLGLQPEVTDNVTEQLSSVSAVAPEAPVSPLNIRSLLSDTIMCISYSSEGITVLHAHNEDEYRVQTEEELVDLCSLFEKISKYEVV